MLSEVFARIPDIFVSSYVLVLVFFSVLWNLSEVLNADVDLTSKYFVVEHSWPLYVYHKLCCSGGIWWWRPLRLLTTWKLAKVRQELCSCPWFFFWMWIFDLLCSTVAGYPGLDPCFQQWSCKYSCYNISHRGLSETFPFCKVTNFRCYTRIQVRNTNPKCRAVTW